MAARPRGEPRLTDFRLVETPIPVPAEGQFLVRAIYLSVDPYMRTRMTDARSYVPPVPLDGVMVGNAVGQIVESRHSSYKVGDYVEGLFGWQEYALSDGNDVRPVDPAEAPMTTALGCLGMPGMTAFFGTFDVARPKVGETFVVSAASGAVGSVVVQLGKVVGCRVVGIAGGPEKCAYVKSTLGADAVVDYKAEPNLRAALRAACPNGVDVFFDNVGGTIFDTVLSLINMKARLIVCGNITAYNLEAPDMGRRPHGYLLINAARMEGFTIAYYEHRYPEGIRALSHYLQAGRLKYREDIVDGFENAPRTFLRLYKGENFGKQLLRIAPESS